MKFSSEPSDCHLLTIINTDVEVRNPLVGYEYHGTLPTWMFSENAIFLQKESVSSPSTAFESHPQKAQTSMSANPKVKVNNTAK
jgi:hypothetical protein